VKKSKKAKTNNPKIRKKNPKNSLPSSRLESSAEGAEDDLSDHNVRKLIIFQQTPPQLSRRVREEKHIEFTPASKHRNEQIEQSLRRIEEDLWHSNYKYSNYVW
jgi:hypothetical protein